MKSTVNNITFLVLLTLALTGCISDKINEAETFSYDDSLITADYHGHRYIIYKGFKRGGITHDPDCPCRKDNHVKLD